MVVRGFTQRKDIDYHETFSPVVRYSSIRYLLALAVKFGLNVTQMDVETAFLHGDLDEEIYMLQPEGFDDNLELVCKLEKSLYGLKQASRVWNVKLNEVLEKFGLKRSITDQCIYHMMNGKTILIVAVYVDDLVIFSNERAVENKLKNCLMKSFKMKDLGESTSLLGMRIIRDKEAGTITIDQLHYIKRLLEKFGLSDCNPVSTPLDVNQKISEEMCPSTEIERKEMHNVPYQEAIGGIWFASIVTRPDISYAVNLLSRFNNCFGKAHWAAVKRVLRYLKGTINKKLVFSSSGDKIKGYCDAVGPAISTKENRHLATYLQCRVRPFPGPQKDRKRLQYLPLKLNTCQ